MLTEEFYERLTEDALLLLSMVQHKKPDATLQSETRHVLESYVWDRKLWDTEKKLKPILPEELSRWRPGRSLFLNDPRNEPGAQDAILAMFEVTHAKTGNALRNRIGELGVLLERFLDDRGVEIQPDGPVDNGFRWCGKQYLGLSGIPWKLLNYLWQNRGSRLSFEDLAAPVWGDSALGSADIKERFRSPQSQVNAFFRDHALPFKVSSRDSPHLKQLTE